AELEETILNKADLRHANLKYTDLTNAHLAGANIKHANMQSANFEGTEVTNILYNRWARYQGIRVDTCYGSPLFKRFAQDQDFIEEFRGTWSRYPFYLLWLILADCGRSLLLWTFWSVSFALLFAFEFYNLGKDAFWVSNLPWSFTTAIYYSVVTFTTLGFGDIVPKTIEAAGWVMAEVIIGYIMLGGLISIFATKIARRS
ncbi:MAG: pentapeptide repeat-containing protein, partial [Candidatus Latescibacterota bacterium]